MRPPSPNPRGQGGIVFGCVNEKHEGSTVSDMWRGVGEKKRKKENTSWSPLSHALHSLVTVVIIRVLNAIQNQKGNRGPVIGEDMKLPAQTSVAGARRIHLAVESWRVVCKHTRM